MPVLLQNSLEGILADIADFDYNPLIAEMDGSIFDGCCGLSLFFYHMYRYSSQNKYYEKARDFLQLAFDKLDPRLLNLSYGVTGAMWILNYYSKIAAFDDDYTEDLETFDASLEERIEVYATNMDTMHGLLSIANYLFTRNTITARKCLDRILQLLDESKVEVDQGIAWLGNGTVGADDEEQYYSFGYAHGVPAILYFLSCYMQEGIQVERASSLFREGMSFFLSNMNNGFPTYFPTVVQKKGMRRTERLSYCYGDLGIACGMTAIANKLHDPELLAKAAMVSRNIAEISLSRDIADVSDIGLCHGAAGNGFMFAQLQKTHQLEVLGLAALQQFQRLTTIRKAGTGIVGFSSIHYDKKIESYYHKADPGFINGTAGVGLSIIAYLTNGSIRDWDTILYLR